MLKTRAKSKIGKHLSYPIGAEAISQFVGAIPQAEKVGICFLDSPTGWASDFNKTLRDFEAYPILRCQFTYDPLPYVGVNSNISWEILVYPVKRELKADARKALFLCGLPELKTFLYQTAIYAGRRTIANHIAFKFDPIEKRIFKMD